MPLATEPLSERRRRVIHRGLPALGALAAGALAAGLVVGSTFGSADERVAERFARAWERGDYAAMYAQLTPAAKARHPRASFDAAYRLARDTATVATVRAREPEGERDGAIVVPVALRTSLFGTVSGELAIPIREAAVDWAPHLVFPGMAEGERLARRTRPPPRAQILSVDGKVLAEGPAGRRSSPLGELAGSIAGGMAPAADPKERRAIFARGFPSDTPVGTSGLERALQRRVEGRPGGELLAGRRVVARAAPLPAFAVRSTIDSRLQASAVTALAGRLGGIAALDTGNGEVRALAGIAFSGPQPPGSTFKIVTTVAALEAGLVKRSDKFPVVSKAVIDGVDLENANGELCGGTFPETFAHSCNSVFAPLGVKVGSKRLVDAAERFGWNAPPQLPGERPSTLPGPKEIVSPLEVGSSAIGQFKVLATPLQMASVAQTIAAGGVRSIPILESGARPRRRRVTTRRVAAAVRDLMVGVTRFGTGTAAAIPGVKVAGKTGTAELEDTRGPDGQPTGVSDPMNTDAWFTAFAPAERPEIAVAVLLVRSGAGGATAAPAAKVVLASALGRKG